MRINMVCLEDGIIATGFRKITSHIERLNPDTNVYYVSTAQYQSLWRRVTRRYRTVIDYDRPDVIDEIAQGIANADIIAFSSMTAYADMTNRLIKRVREVSPKSFIIWGGIHPIVHSEDAITADVDAICTGEGEFAFEEFFDLYKRGEDYLGVRNFWFKEGNKVTRNPFLPLMTNEEMESLSFQKYGGTEWIHRRGGFQPMTTRDYLNNKGLAYPAIWSIGCPLHCTFCANTVFIANDKNYRKVRHPSPAYIVGEVKRALEVHPHLTTVMFHDDSFMALPLHVLEEFARLWRVEIGLPFSVYGVIPTYVREDKFEVLTWAGMNRVRMGIQSGSERILKFYKRPTPLDKVETAAKVIGQFSKYQVNPSFDIIVDNPVELRQDVIDTLELVYRLPRPFMLNVFSLKVIPNTVLEKQMQEAGLDLDEIKSNFFILRPSFGNLLLTLLTFWHPPRWLFDRLLKRVRAVGEPQQHYPIGFQLVRMTMRFSQRLRQLRFADFSLISGRSGYVVWKLGLIKLWLKLFGPGVDRAAKDHEWHLPKVDEQLSGEMKKQPLKSLRLEVLKPTRKNQKR